MKKIVILFSVIIILILIILQITAFVSKRNQVDGSPEVLAAIREAGLTPIGECQENIDSIAGDLDWALINAVCEMGGYELGDYFGKKMLISSCPIEEAYVEEITTNERHPLKAWVLSDSEIICVYTATDWDKDKNPLLPGVYPINEQFIKK